MKNQFKNSLGHTLWAAALVTVAVLVLSLGSCRQRAAMGANRDAHYIEMDSLMGSIHDPDSLALLAKSCHDHGDAVGEMLALRHQGREMRRLSRFGEAIEVHERVLDMATRSADTLEMVTAMDNIAVNYRRLGNLGKANQYLFQALKLCDSHSDQASDEAIKCRVVTLGGIGEIEIQLRNYNIADSMLREALEGNCRLGNSSGMAINYAGLGTVKRYCGDLDSAWVYYRKAMDYNKLDGDEGGVAWCHFCFGEMHELERRYSHAEAEYQLAYDELKRLGESWYLLEPCLALARIHIKLGEEDEARAFIAEAEAEAQRINSKEHQAEVYKAHCELALAEDKPEEAFKYFVRSDDLYDTIRGMSTDEEMRAQRLNYERDRNIGEVNVLNNDIERLKRMRNIMGVLGVLLLLMAAAIIGSLVYAVRVRARSQRVLRQVEETRSLFFTNVVHQLRTPLTAIMGAIDSIITDASKEDNEHYSASQRENVEMIERQGRNLLTLMDRILEVGSVRSAIHAPEWRTGDAVPLLRMIVESYRELCVDRHIELSYVSREAAVDIDTVPDYLRTIVGSLIENAINYSRDFSKITVLSSVEGSKFIIRVADNGIGISREELPHVFEPFFRGSAAERIVDGVGIGLTVVRDMALVMGGSVAVDSEADQGAVFTVTLPSRHESRDLKKPLDQWVRPVKHLMAKPRHEQVASSDTPDAETGKPVMLIVEDHYDVARLVGRVFEGKFNVHYAHDGERGLAMAQELTPKLVITDVKMPVMDGCELCRRIRASEQLCHIPVIMLSARASTEDRVRGIEAGADAYLIKPFVREELEAWAIRLIESRRLMRQNPMPKPMPKPTRAQANAAREATHKTEEISDHEFLRKFSSLVEGELDKGVSKLDVDAIALSFKMGESQLRRRIHALTGKNLAAYLNQLRMEKALTLLQQQPDMLVGEVAEKCGFVDVAYFSRVFRLYYNMTPTQARQHKDEVNE